MVNKILRPANVLYLPVIVRKNVLPVALKLFRKEEKRLQTRLQGYVCSIYIKQNYISV